MHDALLFVFMEVLRIIYFCTMKPGVVCILSLLFLSPAFAQVRMEKLIIRTNQSFDLKGSDILVVDTLIMMDSASIILNKDKADNFIHAKVARIGQACRIIGKGEDGQNGKTGLPGFTQDGPCKNGTSGTSGTRGTSAHAGVNLYLYFTELSIKDKLLIELSGGSGGDGGRGGTGGGGSPGTRLCQGGNGGDGGNGAEGGNGGDGGDLTISCKLCPDLRSWLGNKLIVRSFGGNAGLGGDGGYGGSAGLVSSGNNAKDGEQGTRGQMGKSGEPGKNGAIEFQQN